MVGGAAVVAAEEAAVEDVADSVRATPPMAIEELSRNRRAARPAERAPRRCRSTKLDDGGSCRGGGGGGAIDTAPQSDHGGTVVSDMVTVSTTER